MGAFTLQGAEALHGSWRSQCLCWLQLLMQRQKAMAQEEATIFDTYTSRAAFYDQDTAVLLQHGVL